MSIEKFDMDMIPMDIRPYLFEIAERLWSGHATVMVGAGFSKNAIKTDTTKKDLPNWNELGDVFFEKIYNSKPDQKYLNVLKLAEEVEAAFGRPALDQLLRQQLPDKDFEPSNLHTSLLELPWSDVFTTNYDTLLERGAESVFNQKFDIIVNHRDLIYSERPRIIKLHGSLPSECPLIITEEDYRRYPKDFAPFVNTVQQSLIENTLCLIGFSGDDPNFSQWIGWIHDNLGKSNSPKIYLIGALNLSDAQKRLFASKNIIAVDLSTLKGADNSHYRTLEVFVRFLQSQKSKGSNLDWPHREVFRSTSASKISIIEEWRTVRMSYPNWLILPEEKRRSLWQNTRSFASNDSLSETMAWVDLEFAYELNWRMEKCLCPIFNDMAPSLQKLLDKYNPFPSILTKRAQFNIPKHFKSAKEADKYIEYWKELSLALLRFYREENQLENWNSLSSTIEKICERLNSEQLSKFYYEKCLQAIFRLDFNKLQATLNQWPKNETGPYWEVKRACLLAENGHMEEAINILERSLTFVRKRLNLTPVTTDYTWVSQEAYIMMQLNVISMSAKLMKKTFSLEEDEQSKKFKERWTTLAQYDCDPWQENKYFELILQNEYQDKQPVKIRHAFDIGRVTKTTTFGGDENHMMITYNYLRFQEEIALPLALRNIDFGNKIMSGALQRLAISSPQWAMAVMSRHAREESIAAVLDRQFIGQSKNVDWLISSYVEAFYFLYPESENMPRAYLLINAIPEILSRLCIKCSDESKALLYELIRFIYSRGINLNNLGRLLARVSENSSSRMQSKMLEMFLDLPISSNDPNNREIFPDPFRFLKIDERDRLPELKVDKKAIDHLFEQAGSGDTIESTSLYRLLKLHQLKQLDTRQSKHLFSLIWAHIDPNTGFPKTTLFYKHIFLRMPHPAAIDPLKIYKKYIFSLSFDRHSQSQDGALGITSGMSILAEELCGGSATFYRPEGVRWSSSELDVIWQKCKVWWEADKHFLLSYPKSDRENIVNFHGEFVLRFDNLVKIISQIFGFQEENLSETIKQDILSVIRELPEFGISSIRTRAAFFYDFYGNEEEYLKEVESQLISEKHEQVIDALDSSVMFSQQKKVVKKYPRLLENYLQLVCQPIKWKNRKLTDQCYISVTNIIVHKKNIDIRRNMDILLESLTHLEGESRMEKRNSYSDDEKVVLRKRAVDLSSALYQYLKKHKQPIPQILETWKKISLSANEFHDVVSNWKASVADYELD